MVKYPTPTNSMMTLGDMEQARFSGTDSNRPSYKDANRGRRFPTPSARDWKDGRASQKTLEKNARPLNEIVVAESHGGTSTRQNYLTPTTPRPHDNETTVGKYLESQNQKDLAGQVARKGGQLNPEWVEWLMGVPIGAVNCEPLVMDRFLRWLRAHGMNCSGG